VVGTKLAQAMKAMTGNRRATSEHRTAWEAMAFSQFVGPPHPALGRLRTVKGDGGSNARHTTIANANANAKREGAVAAAQETTKSSQVQVAARRARPNPSFEARPNGKPPGPGHGYGVHYPWPGPGGLPLVPPQLKR